MTKSTLCRLLRAALVAIVTTAGSAISAAPITWIGGNTNWDATITKWNPNDEPDSDDEAIFNTPNSVNLANASESITALTMSGGIDLLLNGNDLTVNGGNVALSGGSTLLDVPTNSTLNTDDVFVNANASLTLHGGTITMAQTGGDAVLTIAADGAIGGFGTINSSDVIAAANTTVLSLGGSLTVLTFDLFSQQAATLAINVPANGRVDLDQTGAVIDITRNDTLDINGAAHDPAVDAYSGTMNLAEGATLDMSNAWGMNGGSINVNTNGINVATAGAAATIAGGDFSQTGGTINLADNLDSLRFSAPYTATGGTINNNGHVIFNNSATINGADFQMNGANASLSVTDGNTVTITQGDFDLGGTGADTNVTTIGDGAVLNVRIDFNSGTVDVLDHTIELNGGRLDVQSTGVVLDTTWHLSGGVVNANLNQSIIVGHELIIQAETFNVAESARLNISPSSVEITNPTINVSGNFNINAPSLWTNSNVSVTGSGTFEPGVPTIGSGALAVDIVWSVTTIDWEDNGPTIINPGSSLTINADVIDIFGDGYDNTINIRSSDLTVNTPAAWRMEGVLNIDNVSAVPTLNGSRMIVGDADGATINVGGNGGAGVHDMNAPLTLETNGVIDIAAGATFQVDGDTIFEGGQVTGGGNFAPDNNNTVNGDTTIDVAQFNFDRGSWTINPDATLWVDVVDYDSDSATNSFNSTITIDNGRLVTITDDAFVVDAATINMINTADPGVPEWQGTPIQIGNDAGVLDTHINISGVYALITANVTFFSDAEVNIDSDSELWFYQGTVNFNSVNGANNASFIGSGLLRLGEITNFNEVTTVSVGGVDLGQTLGFVGTAVTVNADTTINADYVLNYGRFNEVGTDVLTLNGLASLTVNLTDPDDEWQINSPAVVNINASGDPFIGSGIHGSDVNVLGTVNVSGNSSWNARVDLEGMVNTTLASDFIRFGGGSLADPNRLVGGTITGPGTLGALDNDALVGFGTIATRIEFLGNAELLADDGALHINGTIVDVGTIGTNDADGILNVTNPWNTNQADTVFLEGGELRGAPVTVSANGIRGHGLVIAQVLNGGRIQAEGGGVLIVQNPGNINDWDGAGGNGQLNALSAEMEIRDNAAFPFTGTVSVGSGHSLFVNGFELEFEPGSTLSLEGGTYRSTHATRIGGTVSVNAGGPSTLQIAGTAMFENGSSTTLNDDLLLDNPTTVVRVGANFAGGGSLVNLPASTLTAENNAAIDVILENRGELVIGTSPGQLAAADFVQTADGTWHVELGGTGSAQFDRLLLSGQATLDGALELSLLVPYEPTLGDTIQILSATGGLGGTTFADVIQPAGMPAGLEFGVIYGPTMVQLMVMPVLLGDYNQNGVVDAADYTVWRNTLGAMVSVFSGADGNGNNQIDAGDYTVWKAHFGETAGGPGGSSAGASPSQAAVPEPATLSLMLGIVFAASALRCGRQIGN